jgi:ribosomal protein S18 acetylase RimI-like enzyme
LCKSFSVMNEKHPTVCREVQHGTDEYKQTVALRDEILRKPLSLTFGPEELSEERDSFHLACWQDDMLAACLVLKPLSGQQIRMRQLAVGTDFQGKGIGRMLVGYSESFAREHGYREIILHARETAVRFYEKLGYRKEGDYFIEVTIPHLLMRKILDDAREQAESPDCQ